MVSIPKNEYKEDVTVREDVVQGICDVFLAKNIWTTYHPFSDPAGRGYRGSTRYITTNNRGAKYTAFRERPLSSEYGIRFNNAEMDTAVRLLREAGYHFLKVYDYGTWVGYQLSNRPANATETEVETIPHY